MLEKIILAVILTFSIYLRYNPLTAHQQLTQIQNNQPQINTSLVTWRQR
jgi:hypothetical protein